MNEMQRQEGRCHTTREDGADIRQNHWRMPGELLRTVLIACACFRSMFLNQDHAHTRIWLCTVAHSTGRNRVTTEMSSTYNLTGNHELKQFRSYRWCYLR